jgi:hypothetical protein
MNGREDQPLLDSGNHAAHDVKTVENSLSSNLSAMALPDCDGKQIHLGSLWAKQPAVLVFLRHYG